MYIVGVSLLAFVLFLSTVLFWFCSIFCIYQLWQAVKIENNQVQRDFYAEKFWVFFMPAICSTVGLSLTIITLFS
jgi:hypothetical protein